MILNIRLHKRTEAKVDIRGFGACEGVQEICAERKTPFVRMIIRDKWHFSPQKASEHQPQQAEKPLMSTFAASPLNNVAFAALRFNDMEENDYQRRKRIGD